VPSHPSRPYEGHPEYRAIVRGVLESPADDLPRLAAADWLEERGHDWHAWLIRSEVGAGLGGVAELPVCRPRDFCGPPAWRPATRTLRGFVGEAYSDLTSFLAHAEWLFRRHPVERVVLHQWSGGEADRYHAVHYGDAMPADGGWWLPRPLAHQPHARAMLACASLSDALVLHGRRVAGLEDSPAVAAVGKRS